MVQVVAIMMARNCAPTLARVLQHLDENEIPVVYIDHASSDGSEKLTKNFLRRPIIRTVHEPYAGYFSLTRQLEIKRQIIEASEAEWILHVDADEIIEAPSSDENLRQFIERIDRSGYDVIDAQEFVFPPRNEAENFEGSDFVQTMRHYYYFSPPRRTLHRIFRRSYATEHWLKSGGHALHVSADKVSPEKLRLRHYIGLSLNHLRRQYLGRVFSGAELQRGQHGNRVPPHQGFIRAPDNAKLHNLDQIGWSVDKPKSEHLIFDSRSLFRAPKTFRAVENPKPMPFIVGVGRSGTTLLRMMLDSHSQLAIPPETHWLAGLIKQLSATPTIDTDKIYVTLTESPNWPDMEVSNSELGRLLNNFDSDDPFDFVRELYRKYAARFGAFRVGDKTPIHQLRMIEIAQSLPEAHFIHLIRDGRDVACSHEGLWFGPENVADAACMWTWRIGRARQQAQFLPHYMEVRYEDFVRSPKNELLRICEFLQIEFEHSMLTAHRNAKKATFRIGADRTEW